LLKIIGGEARGRILKGSPKWPDVRPILGRIKQSLFDIWQPYIAGARFLDLYAGTGSVGLEALSRGAQEANFVEKDPQCAAYIRHNVEVLGYQTRAKVHGGDATSPMPFLYPGFDLIFMGPPYKDKEKKALALVMPTLQNIEQQRLLKKTGSLAAQHHKKEAVAATEKWDMVRQEFYGDSTVTFFRLKEE
jgi:16S rRNA (guanine966-N2)-methyltransferase